MNLEAVIGHFAQCDCGREHVSDLKVYAMYPGALKDAGTILRSAGFPRIIRLVADRKTMAVTEGLPGILSASGFDVGVTLFEDMRLADMAAVERIESECGAAQALLAVGTGSINDIVKYASFRKGLPCAIFATAPSMDGFASTVAALVDDGLKKSLPSHSPAVIIADSDILAAAPAALKSAGYADILGKYTALLDWKVSALLTGEYYCDRIAKATMDAVDACVGITDTVASSTPATAEILMDALVLAGLGMQFCGNSRPAAGAEHLVSHFWEMQSLREGRQLELHGKKVGIASVMVARKYHEIARSGRIRRPGPPIDRQALGSILGDRIADLILSLNTPSLLDGIDPEFFMTQWETIRDLTESLPSADSLASLLLRAGAWALPEDAGLDEEHTRQGLEFGCLVHRKLTLLQLARMMEW